MKLTIGNLIEAGLCNISEDKMVLLEDYLEKHKDVVLEDLDNIHSELIFTAKTCRFDDGHLEYENIGIRYDETLGDYVYEERLNSSCENEFTFKINPVPVKEPVKNKVYLSDFDTSLKETSSLYDVGSFLCLYVGLEGIDSYFLDGCVEELCDKTLKYYEIIKVENNVDM